MGSVDVIVVVGACGPERLAYAKRLARATRRAFFPASLLAGSSDPAREAYVRASWTAPATGAVVEVPDAVPVAEFIGAFADDGADTRLRGLVCVADAAHVLDDLHRDDYLPLRDGDSAVAAPFVARAQLTVAQLEYASTIVLVNWSALPSAELAVVMALLNHLSPRARLRLHRGAIESLAADEIYSVEQDRPGWVGVLNGRFDPHMTDPRVSALRYEQVRPLRPGRLRRLLDRISVDEFGRILRSAGFFRLATRANVVGHWGHVGRVIDLNPLAVDDDLGEDEEILALGQDLAFIGLDLDRERLVAALDEAALTDDELAAGPSAWGAFSDPFPAWTIVTRD